MSVTRVRLDTQLKATLENGRTVEGRVYRVSQHGWASILDDDGKQWIVPEDAEVTDEPRPVNGRRNIPARLQ